VVNEKTFLVNVVPRLKMTRLIPQAMLHDQVLTPVVHELSVSGGRARKYGLRHSTVMSDECE
jgi:hypothetical protein